jgi:hypothetical protein
MAPSMVSNSSLDELCYYPGTRVGLSEWPRVSNSSLDELCYYQPPRRALIQRTFPGRFPSTPSEHLVEARRHVAQFPLSPRPACCEHRRGAGQHVTAHRVRQTQVALKP